MDTRKELNKEHLYRRLVEAIAFILARAAEQGLPTLSKFQIMKLLYLSQVEALRFSGRPYFSEEEVPFIRGRNGPITPTYRAAVAELEAKGLIRVEPIDNPDYGYTRYDHKIIKEPDTFETPEGDLIFLAQIVNDYAGISQKELRAVVYDTEPMKARLQEEREKGVEIIASRLDLGKIALVPELLDAYSDEPEATEV
ncbi:MAG: hypothetical protein IH851_03545 [Armatimonadetes bacterium]|nr:hypothetical protein [Armatimonadota bacterium]